MISLLVKKRGKLEAIEDEILFGEQLWQWVQNSESVKCSKCARMQTAIADPKSGEVLLVVLAW